MKRNPFLLMAFLGVLMVAAVGCTTVQGAQDDGYYENSTSRTAPSRIYVDDPYHYGRTILMERDPYTGKYYEVSPNSIYNNGYSTYDPYGNSRYDTRRYDRRTSNSGYGRRQPAYQQPAPPRPTEQERQEAEQKRRTSKDVILGRKN
jgi:hypothetical protein